MKPDGRRVLLDECVPQDLRHALPDFEVQTAEYAGLAGISNGALISAAEGRFDVIVTTDKRLKFQQNLTGRLIAVVVLDAASNRLPDLLLLVEMLVAAIHSVKPGEVQDVAFG
jgi:hypothetical protein